MNSLTSSLLNVKKLNVHYHSKANSFHALRDIDLHVKHGEVLALVGETGSGKTTLGRTLLNLNSEKAETEFDQLIYKNDSYLVNQLRGKEIGMLFQEPTIYLNPTSSCGSQILESLQLDGIFVGDAQEIVIKNLKELGFDQPGRIFKSYPNQLSGGECQRVMLLMATIRNPSLLIADEPTSSVDLVTKEKIFEYFKFLVCEKGISIILITHDLNMALNNADRIAVMNQGEMIDLLEVSEFETSEKSRYSQRLFQSSNKLKTAVPLKAQSAPAKFLKVDNLEITHTTSGGRSLFFNKKKNVLTGVSFTLYEGETLGILGESGSGKTSLVWCISGLLKEYSGSLNFEKKIKHESDIQLVFQNPALALSPKQLCGFGVEEVISANRSKHDSRPKRELAKEYFEFVNLDETLLDRYPHELSGGEKQRVCIAKALAAKPKLIIFDEAVSSLDAAVKTEVLELLVTLRKKLNLTYIFISHDFSVIKFVAERVMILHEGKIIEQNTTEQLIKHQINPITTKLLLQS